MPDTKTEILTKDIDYVIDCIDTVTAKIALVMKCKAQHTNNISFRNRKQVRSI